MRHAMVSTYQVEQVFDTIYDPCSVAAGRPKSLLEMGLLVDWSCEGGAMKVTLCTTFAACMMAPKFIEEAEPRLLAIDGVEAISIEVDPGFFWTPDRMRERYSAAGDQAAE